MAKPFFFFFSVSPKCTLFLFILLLLPHLSYHDLPHIYNTNKIANYNTVNTTVSKRSAFGLIAGITA